MKKCLQQFLLLLIFLVSIHAAVLAQALCPKYCCGLALLLSLVSPVISKEGTLTVVQSRLTIPSFENTDILTNETITDQYLRGKIAFLIFVDIYNFDYVPVELLLEFPSNVLLEPPGYETKRALSVLQKVHEALGEAGVAVIAVLGLHIPDRQWLVEKARSLSQELGLTFPIIFDPKLWEVFKVETASYEILVADREGNVRFRGKADDTIICGLAIDCSHLAQYLMLPCSY